MSNMHSKGDPQCYEYSIISIETSVARLYGQRRETSRILGLTPNCGNIFILYLSRCPMKLVPISRIIGNTMDVVWG